MNIDLDDIMLFASQAVGDVMKEYGRLTNVEKVKDNGKFLLPKIVQYLTQDALHTTVRKCAVNMHLAVVISQARKLATTNEQDLQPIINVLNDLHQNFIRHCQGYEEFLTQTQNSVNIPSRSLKM